MKTITIEKVDLQLSTIEGPWGYGRKVVVAFIEGRDLCGDTVLVAAPVGVTTQNDNEEEVLKHLSSELLGRTYSFHEE